MDFKVFLFSLAHIRKKNEKEKRREQGQEENYIG